PFAGSGGRREHVGDVHLPDRQPGDGRGRGDLHRQAHGVHAQPNRDGDGARSPVRGRGHVLGSLGQVRRVLPLLLLRPALTEADYSPAPVSSHTLSTTALRSPVASYTASWRS